MFKKLNFITPIIVLSSIFSCKSQNQDFKTESPYQIISETTINLGSENSIRNATLCSDGNFLFYARVESDKDRYGMFSFLKLSPQGDSLGNTPVSFDYFLTDYLEVGDYFYVVTTNLNTMGPPTEDFFHKYDKNWKLIWTKKINKAKFPDGNTVLMLNKSKEILFISQEWFPKKGSVPIKDKHGFAIKRFDLEGKLLSDKFYDSISNPVSIIKSNDDCFFLTAENWSKNNNDMVLVKLNQKGEIIWTKKYENFYPEQTILTSNKELICYGTSFKLNEEGHYIESLKILSLDLDGNLFWQKEIKEKYYDRPGNMIETKNGNYLFSAVIKESRNNQSIAYLFELEKHTGKMVYETKFNFKLGINSVPIIIKGNKQITLINQKWIGKSGEPFNDIIQITKLSE